MDRPYSSSNARKLLMRRAEMYVLVTIVLSLLADGCVPVARGTPPPKVIGHTYDAAGISSLPTVQNGRPANGTEKPQGSSPAPTEITHYPDFKSACLAFVTGYVQHDDDANLSPAFDKRLGDCIGKEKPLVVSVTHENETNNHNGSANFNPGISSFMGDFDYDADFGRWFKVDISGKEAPIAEVMLDTINNEKINVTGWPLRFGHLFVGFEDVISTSLGKPIYVEFDIRISTGEVRRELYQGYSGRRVLLGLLANWAEVAPRANRAHFFEIDLMQSDGYTESYREPDRPYCMDAVYDRCFYDPKGQFPEGREIRFGGASMASASIALGTAEWTHVRLPMSELIRKLRWVSPPSDWNSATIEGLYFAIESEGATRTIIQVKSYHVYAAG